MLLPLEVLRGVENDIAAARIKSPLPSYIYGGIFYGPCYNGKRCAVCDKGLEGNKGGGNLCNYCTRHASDPGIYGEGIEDNMK